MDKQRGQPLTQDIALICYPKTCQEVRGGKTIADRI